MNSPIKRRIMVVDDDIGMTTLCRNLLERTGRFTVRTENNALQAVATAAEFRPHLIFLDRHMPGRTGAEVATALGDDPQLRGIPIVFLTGDVDAATKSLGHPVLLKPVRASDLIDTCTAWALLPMD